MVLWGCLPPISSLLCPTVIWGLRSHSLHPFTRFFSSPTCLGLMHSLVSVSMCRLLWPQFGQNFLDVLSRLQRPPTAPYFSCGKLNSISFSLQTTPAIWGFLPPGFPSLSRINATSSSWHWTHLLLLSRLPPVYSSSSRIRFFFLWFCKPALPPCLLGDGWGLQSHRRMSGSV